MKLKHTEDKWLIHVPTGGPKMAVVGHVYQDGSGWIAESKTSANGLKLARMDRSMVKAAEKLVGALAARAVGES